MEKHFVRSLVLHNGGKISYVDGLTHMMKGTRFSPIAFGDEDESDEFTNVRDYENASPMARFLSNLIDAHQRPLHFSLLDFTYALDGVLMCDMCGLEFVEVYDYHARVEEIVAEITSTLSIGPGDGVHLSDKAYIRMVDKFEMDMVLEQIAWLDEHRDTHWNCQKTLGITNPTAIGPEMTLKTLFFDIMVGLTNVRKLTDTDFRVAFGGARLCDICNTDFLQVLDFVEWLRSKVIAARKVLPSYDLASPEFIKFSNGIVAELNDMQDKWYSNHSPFCAIKHLHHPRIYYKL